MDEATIEDLKMTVKSLTEAMGTLTGKVAEMQAHPDYTYVGCFWNFPPDRDLPVYIGRSDSISGCASACVGYEYAGRQLGNLCFCGDSYGKQGEARGCVCDSLHNEMNEMTCVYKVPSIASSTASPSALSLSIDTVRGEITDLKVIAYVLFALLSFWFIMRVSVLCGKFGSVCKRKISTRVTPTKGDDCIVCPEIVEIVGARHEEDSGLDGPSPSLRASASSSDHVDFFGCELPSLPRDTLLSSYTALCSIAGLPYNQSEARRWVEDVGSGGMDSEWLDTLFKNFCLALGQEEAAKVVLEEAVLNGVADTGVKRVARDLKSYSVREFQRYFEDSWLSEWLRAAPATVEERRIAADGQSYTAQEFQARYGDAWLPKWLEAARLPKWLDIADPLRAS